MNKHLICLVFAVIVALTSAVSAGDYSGGGEGTAEEPYRIATAADMNEIGNHIEDFNKCFVLVNDINLAEYTGTEFNIIGSSIWFTPFTGVFDGNGHTISNFTYTASGKNCFGLFGYVTDPNAVIKDLTLVDPNVNAAFGLGCVGSLVGWLGSGAITGCGIEGGSITGRSCIGGLVGRNDGTISDCYAAGGVTGYNYSTGGLVGRNFFGTISTCYGTGSVTGEGYTGGLVGENYGGSILGSYAASSVTATGPDTGGLVGFNSEGMISSCYAAGSVTGGNDDTGGLVGRSYEGTISNCYATGGVTGTNEYTGGLVGLSDGGTISNCYAAGSVTGYRCTGGLVGDNYYGTISNCYTTGGVLGGDWTGGLVGRSYGTILNCYAAGSVTGYRCTGGLVGDNYYGTISNCYATGSVTGNRWTGGLAGGNGGMISNCCAEGRVTGDEYTGGLLGMNDYGTISNCYATGSVDGNDMVGGLIGRFWEGGMIENCYAASCVVADANGGGLVGYNDSGSYTSSFWDSDVNPDVNGIGNTTDPNVIGKTTAEMKTESTFTDAGWDFIDETANGIEDIWRLCEDGTDYPKLAWQFMLGDFVCGDGVDFDDIDVFMQQWLMEKLSADVAVGGGDGVVDFVDWAVLADGWQNTIDLNDVADFAGQWLQFGAYCADIAPSPGGDGVVDFYDWAVLAGNWLEGVN